MFIKFYIPDNKTLLINGGVDTVMEKYDSDWTIVPSKTSILSRPTNYYFGDSEDILFDKEDGTVVFKGKKYSINNFIDLLEKNHMRDMFLKSKLLGSLRILTLHTLFFMTDSRYKKMDYVFSDIAHSTKVKERITIISSNTDPLFHYFKIYKNLLGLSLLLFLPILFLLSVNTKVDWFTISNPFLLFLALFILFLLEKLSATLFKLLSKEGFVYNMTRPALDLKGKLKKY